MYMKVRLHLLTLILVSFTMVVIHACKKDDDSDPANQEIRDIDGNVYTAVTIGNQVWMAQNLKTTRFRDGSALAYPGSDLTGWKNNTTGAYAYLFNDEASFRETYGALYNWAAVNTGKLCPEGWHVPTESDWNLLFGFLGDSMVAGGKMKTSDTTLWLSPNTAASNSSGFSALPGGYRDHNGMDGLLKKNAFFWTADNASTNNAWHHKLDYQSTQAYGGKRNKRYGLSVRCLKD